MTWGMSVVSQVSREGPVRGVQLQHSAGQSLAGFSVHLGEMHHGLGVCDVLQVYIGLVYFYGDGFFHSDVARDSFQFSYLVIAVGGFEAENSPDWRPCCSLVAMAVSAENSVASASE